MNDLQKDIFERFLLFFSGILVGVTITLYIHIFKII